MMPLPSIRSPRRFFLLAVPAFAALIFAALIGGAVAPSLAEESAGKSIKLVIDYGDGVQTLFPALPAGEDMTVLDVMQRAAEHPRGITFKFKGRGATALLTQIDDAKNEGAGRNWLYSVNGKLADRSFAIFAVEPGDTVLWEFRKYR